ncbi:unnamed protein product [Durusdinium trenchii]|uniref:Fructose-bisphosphate aldolase n=1 Tax=Durusdinium trenchii TaxID=1381693 RepID=A0ABP0IU44_9DINO
MLDPSSKSTPPVFAGDESLKSLRRALVSKKIYGAWRSAPSDSLLRINFASKKLISGQEAPKEEVYAAMKDYAARRPDRPNGASVVARGDE